MVMVIDGDLQVALARLANAASDSLEREGKDSDKFKFSRYDLLRWRSRIKKLLDDVNPEAQRERIPEQFERAYYGVKEVVEEIESELGVLLDPDENEAVVAADAIRGWLRRKEELMKVPNTDLDPTEVHEVNAMTWALGIMERKTGS